MLVETVRKDALMLPKLALLSEKRWTILERGDIRQYLQLNLFKEMR